jgi:hypothetical protein
LSKEPVSDASSVAASAEPDPAEAADLWAWLQERRAELRARDGKAVPAAGLGRGEAIAGPEARQAELPLLRLVGARA